MQVIRATDRSFIPASHEDASRPGVLKKVLLTLNDLKPGKVQMINWALLPAGSSFQAHYHEDMQEVFVLMNGPVRMEVGTTKVELNRGDTLVVDPTESHLISNSNDYDVEYLVVGISGDKQGKTVVVNSA